MTTPASERSEPTASIDDALRRLRQSGGRITSAKQALIEFFFTAEAMLTAEQIGALHPDVDNSTIYRCLSQFEELGIIEHVHMGHGAAVYRRGGTPTAPITCVVCGRTEQTPISLLLPLVSAIEEETGIDVDLVHFPLSGRCIRCRSDVRAI